MTDIQDIISCSVCMEIFEKPRALPCQHTFCEHCLTEYISERIKKNKRKDPKSDFNFPCPLCRKNTPVSASSEYGATFPLNLTIIALCDTAEVVKGIQETTKENDKGNNETEEDIESNEREKDHCNPPIRDTDDTDEFDVDAIKLDSNDVFADVILCAIIIPISCKNCSRWIIARAVVYLLFCMIVYCILVQFIFSHGVKILLVPPLFTLFRNIFREITNHNFNNEMFKLCLFHIVVHISSCVMIAMLLLFTLLGACAIERIIATTTTNAVSQRDFVIILRESLEMTEHSLINLRTFWSQLLV